MKTTKEDFIRPSELYEYTLRQMENNTLTLDEQEKVIQNLIFLEWVKDIFQRMTPELMKMMYMKTVEDIENEAITVDIMSLSCLVWHFKKNGTDTRLLESTINSSSYIAEELSRQMRETYCDSHGL